MTLSAYEEEAFALIVARVEEDVFWHRIRRLFLAIGVVVVGAALLLLPRYVGVGPALAFAISFCSGAVVALMIGPRLFRRPP